MISKGTSRLAISSNHQTKVSFLVPSARCSITLISLPCSFTARTPALSKVARRSNSPPFWPQLLPSGHSMPPLISLPTCTMSGTTPALARASMLSLVWA
ncbi:hypothetical protein D3C75_1188450 [compost metagenome]